MRRYPAYTLDAVADLTPYQQQALLSGDDVLTFATDEEYQAWTRTRLSS